MLKSQNPDIIVILNNIRSSENVGAIFRTCDAAGVSKVILCGYTPAPIDRFDRPNSKLAKAALGAEKIVKWEKSENLAKTIKKLRKPQEHPVRSQMLRISRSRNVLAAFKIVAIEQDKKAVDYRKLKKLVASSQHLVLIFGNEVEGLSQKDLTLCDLIAELPMRKAMVRQAHHPRYSKAGKESLNVAVCAGIVLYSLV